VGKEGDFIIETYYGCYEKNINLKRKKERKRERKKNLDI